jgi:hypothetical protein
LADIKDSHGSLLRDFVDVSRPFSTFDLPAASVGEIHEDIFAPDSSVPFVKGRKQIALLPTKSRQQAALIPALPAQGVRGLTRVPLAPQDRIDGRAKRLRRLISDRTDDPDLGDRIFATLNDSIRYETNRLTGVGRSP